MNRITRAALLAVLLMLPLSTLMAQPYRPGAQQQQQVGQQIAQFRELEQKAREAYESDNWVRFFATNRQLHEQRPFVPEYLVNMVLAASRLERKTTAYHYMLIMQQQGLAFDFDAFDETKPVRGTEAYDYINDLLKRAGEPAGEGEKVFTLEEVPPADLGDVAWDPTRERFLVGTRKEGRLYAVDDDGKAQVLLEADDENGLWSIDGLAVDAVNNTLWVASTATPAFAAFSPADAHRGALFAFELDTLAPAGRFNLPVDRFPHELGAVAVSAAGDVYVVDRATPIVYRKPAGGTRLEPFAGGPQFVALTDITVTPDNSRLFVSDLVMGVLVIDPAAGRSAMLSGGEHLNLYGIFGVQFVGGQLIITQSGLQPQRIMRLTINPDGMTVGDVAPMAIALEDFDMPGVGTLRDDALYYFANHGTLAGDTGALLMSTSLDAGKNIEAPDVRQFEEALKQATQKAAGQ